MGSKEINLKICHLKEMNREIEDKEKQCFKRDSTTFHDHSSFIHIAQRWNYLICSSVHEWINKMWHIYKIQYYSALKGKEILKHTTMWMNHKNLTLSETY